MNMNIRGDIKFELKEKAFTNFLCKLDRVSKSEKISKTLSLNEFYRLKGANEYGFDAGFEEGIEFCKDSIDCNNHPSFTKEENDFFNSMDLLKFEKYRDDIINDFMKEFDFFTRADGTSRGRSNADYLAKQFKSAMKFSFEKAMEYCQTNNNNTMRKKKLVSDTINEGSIYIVNNTHIEKYFKLRVMEKTKSSILYENMDAGITSRISLDSLDLGNPPLVFLEKFSELERNFTVDDKGPPLPKYKCHKVVEAGMITDIEIANATYYDLFLGNGTVVKVTSQYMKKHAPYLGGYFVRYEDNYESFSPAKVFEEGYHLIED